MVECLPGGEVSGFLHDEAAVGDVLELRGPIGGWFVWEGDVPAICVAGGSGVVPIVAMTRVARRLGLQDRLKVGVVARTWGDLPYAAELQRYGAFRAVPRETGGAGGAARPSPEGVAAYAEAAERAYVGGSVGFASFATRLLEESGVRSDTIRVEQFGETG